jgi:EmrB/QacA subfamily drug resistance transporter
MSRSQARLTVAAAVLGSVVVFVDSTVVNVALPAIANDLGGGLAGQQWLSGAYLLTLGALLLLGGSLGDLHGRRRMFVIGLVGFGVASLLCAAAPTIETLIAARALQGVAGALLVPNTLGLIVAKFPPGERGAAIGSWTAWTGIAMVAGPLVGGLIVDSASWRWIFIINVVPIAAALAVVARVDAEHDVPTPGTVDVVGAVLGTLGLAGPVFALIEQPQRGWTDPLIAGSLIGGLILLAVFVLYERRATHPMLPLELFRQRNFAVGNLATLTIYGGLGAAPFFLVLFLQQVAGYSALGAGLATLPLTVIMFLLSKRFGALADRLGPRLFMGVGPLVAGVGIALFARIDASADYVADVLPAVLVFGFGLSMTVAPLTATVLGGVAEAHAGMASAINNATARIAGLLAVAALGAVVSAQFSAALDRQLSGIPVDPSFVAGARQRVLAADAPASLGPRRAVVADALDDSSVHAFRVAMLITGGLVAAGGVLSALWIQNPRREVRCADHSPGPAVGASTEVDPAHASI